MEGSTVEVTTVSRRHDGATTALLWGVAGVLVLVAAPALRSMVPLSDELDLGSLIMPWWSLLQMTILAAVLRLLSKRSSVWSTARRAWIATAVAMAVYLLSPTILSLIFGVFSGDLQRLGQDKVQLALLWSTPLLFYVVPAALVIWMWSRAVGFTIARSVGAAFLAIAVGNLVAIFWFTTLWERFVSTSG